jgi:hypothetical protein
MGQVKDAVQLRVQGAHKTAATPAHPHTHLGLRQPRLVARRRAAQQRAQRRRLEARRGCIAAADDKRLDAAVAAAARLGAVNLGEEEPQLAV